MKQWCVILVTDQGYSIKPKIVEADWWKNAFRQAFPEYAAKLKQHIMVECQVEAWGHGFNFDVVEISNRSFGDCND